MVDNISLDGGSVLGSRGLSFFFQGGKKSDGLKKESAAMQNLPPFPLDFCRKNREEYILHIT